MSSFPEDRDRSEAVPEEFASGESSIALLGLSPEVVVFAVFVEEVAVDEVDAGDADDCAAAAGSSVDFAWAVSAFFAASGSSLDRYCEKIYPF